MSVADPITIYETRIQEFSLQIEKLNKKKNLIAWSRFFSIVAIIASFYFLRTYGYLYAFLAAAILFGVFLRLVVLSVRNNELISNLNQLLNINRSELDINNGLYLNLAEGREFLPALHDYAQDLDVFGRSSLYQYFNRTTSEQGQKLFASGLLEPANPDQIIAKQQAAMELTGLYEWRQQLQALGMANQITFASQDTIEAWLQKPNQFVHPAWKWIRIIFPGIILTALLLNVIDILPSAWFYTLILLFFLFSGWISRKVHPVYLTLNKIVKVIDTLSKSLQWIEHQPFTSPLLHSIRDNYLVGSSKASQKVKALKGILDMMDYRLNPLVFIPLNIFLLWDLQQVLALENWRLENRSLVRKWFEGLGEMEALSTLGTISFNHPSWVFPVLDQKHGTFSGEEIGHPLIPESKRVCNSFETEGIPRIALITGSNMAGKSTFLRSIGVNIVLAMMGAPVCAKSLTVSHMGVISSMRVTDNLEESTSTFYAELKKLKQIIEAVNRGEKVFLLLDEILRGTNSLDRQVGSKALIRQLIQHKATGMLATHDLELAKLEDDYPDSIHNYHFDVQVSGEELYFDYQLKEGVCQSLNASILMKKIGIEL